MLSIPRAIRSQRRFLVVLASPSSALAASIHTSMTDTAAVGTFNKTKDNDKHNDCDNDISVATPPGAAAGTLGDSSPGDHLHKGATDLSMILSTLNVVRHPGTFYYASVPDAVVNDFFQTVNFTDIIMTCKEPADQATTVILDKTLVEGIYQDVFATTDEIHIMHDFPAAWLQLEMHTSLNAVGVTAAISKVLGEAKISANVIAAYYHDHVFVHEKDADRAIQVLTEYWPPQHKRATTPIK